MSNNVNVLATATVPGVGKTAILEQIVTEDHAWRKAQAEAADAWAKVARTHRHLAKLYTLRDASRSVEFVGGAMPSNDREEAWAAQQEAISAEIQSLECRLPLLRDNAYLAVSAAKAVLEVAAGY